MICELCGGEFDAPRRHGSVRRFCSSRCRDRAKDLAVNYGLTCEAYRALAATGVCSACRTPSSGRMSVDHCHETGRVRGLVHQSCNVGLGQAGDDPDVLFRWASHLVRSSFDLRDLCAR